VIELSEVLKGSSITLNKLMKRLENSKKILVMTRQEELNEAWCKYMGKCSTEIIQALAFALKWADAHHHWTSVEDELPKENGRYLFYHERIGVQLVYYYNDLTLDKAVTHWMPMPEPPKE
jgi:hypothetical protein